MINKTKELKINKCQHFQYQNIKFLIDRLNKDKDFSKLTHYLLETWFKKNPDLYNYNKLLNNQNEENNTKILQKFFLTNNISKALYN